MYGRGVHVVGALDASDLAVEVAQHGQGVDAFGSGVVGDLVVAEHVDVDRGPAFAHVVDDALHRDVTGDDRRERAQQGVDPAPLDAGLDAAPPLPAAASRSRPISTIAAINVLVAWPGREK